MRAAEPATARGAMPRARVAPIFCGGANAIDQQREQWTDGANAFALAPGIILLYERNVRTAEELARHGYHIVYEDDLLLGRTELETGYPYKATSDAFSEPAKKKTFRSRAVGPIPSCRHRGDGPPAGRVCAEHPCTEFSASTRESV